MRRNRLLVAGIVACAILVSSACGGAQGGSSGSGKSASGNPPAKDTIKVEDIAWTVKPSVIDGERVISFDYTNNSKYTIMDVELHFVQKEGVTDDQYEVFDELKESKGYSDDEVKKIYILGYNRKFAEPGETVTDSPCVINGTYVPAQTMEQYELMEPEMMSIAYIGKDGRGYAEYYDYKTNVYGDASKGGIELKEWSETAIAKTVPEPDSIAINVSKDEEDKFFFIASDMSLDDYKSYIEGVKEKGYTDINYEFDDSFKATNAEGYEILIYYNSAEETVTGSINKK